MSWDNDNEAHQRLSKTTTHQVGGMIYDDDGNDDQSNVERDDDICNDKDRNDKNDDDDVEDHFFLVVKWLVFPSRCSHLHIYQTDFRQEKKLAIMEL